MIEVRFAVHDDARPPRHEKLRAAIYGLILLWMNAYVCREFFFNAGAHMNSMQGFWIALAKRADGSWFHPSWWPYWDCGIPFEFTYAPLVPALTAIVSALRGVPDALSFATVTGIAYCLVPLTLFLAAWRLTRRPGYSFAAALFYSLASPTQILAPDSDFHWTGFWEPRRLFVVNFWDDTPHLLGLAFLPLTILFLARAIETGRRRYYAAAAASIAMSTLASAFGPVAAALAAICLIAARGRKDFARSATATLLVGLFAYALSAAFLPPSLIATMQASTSSGLHSEGWTAGSLTAIAIVVLGWVVLSRYLPLWTADWRLRFFAFFAYLTSSIPIIFVLLHRQFLPQAGRYRPEMELGVALVVVFGSRAWFEKMPVPVKRAAIFLVAALAIEQIVFIRDRAKIYLAPGDVTKSIEYRSSTWAAENLLGVRVMFPGSIAQWAAAFSDVSQFSGSSWSIAYNHTQQRGLEAIYKGGDTAERDARVSLAWLKAFGVGAVAISSPDSEEFWKGFAHPTKFDGVLQTLWSEAGVTIYRVPQRSASLAHVIPEAAVVRNAPARVGDIAAMELYNASLDDPSLASAEMRWDGRNRIRIRTAAFPGQAISVQVSYHPGWHAIVNGRRAELDRDGLGLMWLRPGCNGACEVELNYDGGFELRACRFLSLAAIALLIALMCFPNRRTPAAVKTFSA